MPSSAQLVAGPASPSVRPGAVSRLLVELARIPRADPARFAPLRPGSVVGRFELRRELGRGGFGIVYEACDLQLGRDVAVKLIAPGRARGSSEERAMREAETVAALAHPNVVTLFDVGRCESGPFLVLELLRGETLAHRLRQGPLRLDGALDVAIDVARALAYAHAQGVVHRDLKPGNIFLVGNGNAKVLDFGLARLLANDGGEVGGTPGYMAPEQCRGEPGDARSDIFSAAATLRECVASTEVPRQLDKLLSLASSDDPEKRPQNAQEWLDGLAAIRHASSRLRRRIAIGSAAAIVAALAAVLAVRGPSPAPFGGLTASAEAYEHYIAALRCLDRFTLPHPECAVEFARATEADRSFAQAYWMLATSRYWSGSPGAREALERAVQLASALSEQERDKIFAFAAELDGRNPEAAALYDRAAARDPRDKRLLVQAADFFMTGNEPERALPLLDRALAIDAGHGPAMVHKVWALGMLRRNDDLAAFATALERLPGAAPLVALANARGWLGDGARAIDAARRAAATARTDELADTRLLVATVRAFFGELQPDSAEIAGDDTRFLRAQLLGLRGRYREGVRHQDAGLDPDVAIGHYLRAEYLVGSADPSEVWSEAQQAAALDPAMSASLAVHLAYAGDLVHAAELARRLTPGSRRARTYEAVAAWKRGQRPEALRMLREVSAAVPGSFDPPVLPPSLVLGEVCLEAGLPSEAAAALRVFQSLYNPYNAYRAWAYPRSEYLLARAEAELGHISAARSEVDRLLERWSRADEDLPLLADARRLSAELRAAEAKR